MTCILMTLLHGDTFTLLLLFKYTYCFTDFININILKIMFYIFVLKLKYYTSTFRHTYTFMREYYVI